MSKKHCCKWVKQARKNLFNTIAIGERDWVTPLKQKSRETSQCCYEITEKYWRMLWGALSVIRLPVFANCEWSHGCGLTPFSHIETETGSIFLDDHDYISKESLPGPWERHYWVLKLSRTRGKVNISKGERKNLQLQVLQSQCPKKRKSQEKNLSKV